MLVLKLVARLNHARGLNSELPKWPPTFAPAEAGHRVGSLSRVGQKLHPTLDRGEIQQ